MVQCLTGIIARNFGINRSTTARIRIDLHVSDMPPSGGRTSRILATFCFKQTMLKRRYLLTLGYTFCCTLSCASLGRGSRVPRTTQACTARASGLAGLPGSRPRFARLQHWLSTALEIHIHGLTACGSVDLQLYEAHALRGRRSCVGTSGYRTCLSIGSFLDGPSHTGVHPRRGNRPS